MSNGIHVEINVPCVEGCNSITQQFTVEPALPNGSSITWPTKLGGNLVESFNVLFERGDEALEQGQYAEMIAVISDDNDEWEFYGNGTEIITSSGNCQYEFSSKIISPKMVAVTVSKVASEAYSFGDISHEELNEVIKVTRENQLLSVGFRYVMKHKPTDEIYMSQDPRMGSRR